MPTFTFAGGAVSGKADIDALKGQPLVDCYNALTGKTTKKFGSREKGLEQTLGAFNVWRKQQPGGDEPDPTEAKSFRKDSNRGKVITLASKAGGATFKALKEATGWDDGDLKAALARIKSYNGLTVVTTGEGDEATVVVSGTLRNRKAFDFQPKKEQKNVKAESKRGRVLALLLGDGGTFEEVKALADWDDRYAYEGIRLLHSYAGYGINETPDGKIHAFKAS